MSNFTVIISAPSGAGKSTIINHLLRQNSDLAFAISSTTRAMRSGEENGREYYFTDSQTFKQDVENDDFLEWAEVHGHYYGTRKKEIDRIKASGRIPVLDIDVQGASILREKIQDGVFIFILPPSLKVLESRLRNRKTDSDQQIRVRLAASLEEMRGSTNFDYAVINSVVEDAVGDIESILKAEQLRMDRMRNSLEILKN
ncbi:MAG: guanylate kinase [Spirochaetes bacterium]|jgi:guanylate kinase|nr:guanylate kinase [Spirochaetota bacterium]